MRRKNIYASVKIKEVISALERFAPLPLQESWDNAGLQLGLTEAEVSGALLCLDVTEAIIDEAVGKGCNLVVSHHPLLFRGLKHITGATDVERAVMKALKSDVAVVSMHTNMDNAEGGVNWKIAQKLGLTGIRPLRPREGAKCEGAIGELPEEMVSCDFVLMLKRALEAESVMANQLLRRRIKRVALCGGAGDFMLDDALAQEADAFVTGEMHYHQYAGHDQQIQICVVGHYESEHFTTEVFADILARECPEVRVVTAETNTNPILYL